MTCQPVSHNASGSKFSLDVGFDLQALPKIGNRVDCAPKSSDLPAMLHGFTIPHVDGNPVALALRIQTRHPMQVNLFDLTSPELSHKIEQLSFKISFEKGREQENVSPVDLFPGHQGSLPRKESEPFEVFEIYPDKSTDGAHSTVFGGTFPGWHVLPPGECGVKFPENQKKKAPKTFPMDLFQIKNPGCYYFTLELKVDYLVSNEKDCTMKTKTFRSDPEMVVENVGSSDEDIKT